MDKIKYCSKSSIFRKRSTKKRKNMALLVSLIVVLTIIVGGTIAYIYTKTEGIKNTFIPSTVTCNIEETFQNNIKSNVCITNTGETEAYIRAAILVNWMPKEENTSNVKKVSASKPVLGEDYLLVDDKNDKWIMIGDYYYYKSPVAVDQSTSVLIKECKQLTEKEGYYLSVEILAEAIQSTPSKAVEESWNIKIADDRTITGKGGQ